MPVTGAPPPPDPPAEQRSVDAFDLAEIRRRASAPDFRAVKKTCGTSAAKSGEIIVCAPDPEKERLRAPVATYSTSEGLPRAEWSLGDDTKIDLHVESARMPGGTVSNRVMAGIKLEF